MVLAAAAAATLALAGCSGSEPVPDPEPTSTPTQSPGPTAASPMATDGATPTADGGAPMVPMGMDVDLPRPPVWGVPTEGEWTLVVKDQGGTNRLTNANGCILTTQQIVGTIQDIPGSIPGVNDERPTDSTATQHYLEKVVTDAQAVVRTFEVSGPAQSLPIDVGEGQQRIEFAAVDFAYTTADTGEARHTLVAARLMPRPAAQLTAELTCPAAEFDASRSILEDLRLVIG